MNDLLRILLIDDNPDDRLLVIRELRREFPDLQVEQITEAEGFAQALEAGDFDLMITDYQLRWSDGLAVLRAVKARCPDCPVIMFTCTGSEEIAVQAMKNGLDDYILKSPKHFIRLPAAVRSALKRAEDSIERKRAEETLRKSEERLRRVIQNMPVMLDALDADNNIIAWNRECERVTGYTAEEIVGNPKALELLYPDTAYLQRVLAEYGERGDDFRDWELELTSKEGSVKTVAWSNISQRFPIPGWATWSTGVDITERKRAERLLRTLNQVALAMGKALTPEEIFTTVAEELKRLSFSCGVFLTDDSQNKLFPKYLSYEAGAVRALEKLTGLKAEEFSITVETVTAYRKVIWERKSVFVENAEEVVRQVLPKPAKRFTRQIVRMLKIPKSISAPLIVKDEVVGLLLVQSDDLTEEDIPAITAFAYQMAAAWRKVLLLQHLKSSLTEVERAQEELQQSFVKLQRTLEGTVNVLVSTVEMRDPYTAGHQRRVTQLACAIAKEMGLPEEQIEGLRMAGLIHDLGKITIPAEILSKPGQLSDIEWGLIKAHSQAGYDVLKTVDFPWPVAEIVLEHHKRLDGSGYPQELSGAGILMKARIMAVADVVEAMASHRPYRPARGLDKALEEISQNRGVLYDPEVVDVCLKLFTENGFKFE